MNKKGFTLVEVLGVMVIIVTISLIILPNIINRFSNKKEDISNANKEIIVSAAKLYVSDNKEELNDYTTYCVDINELIKNKYLSEKKDVFSDNDYASNHKVKVTIGKTNEYEVVESSSCSNKSIYDAGNKIKVAGIDFYIISNHDDYVVALKAEPLTVDEVNLYGGVGTENNHVNRYTYDNVGTAYDWEDTNHTGGMKYYTSETCGYANGYWVYSGCTTDYNSSEVKYVVDAWAADKFTNELKEVDGYSARLVQKEELRIQFYPSCSSTANSCNKESTTPSWLYNSNYYYWTMSPYDSLTRVWVLFPEGNLENFYVNYNSYDYYAVRPVINVKKSAIQDIITE